MRREAAARAAPRIAVAALLAAACSDAVSPYRSSPGSPAFSHTETGGIALDQHNGSLRQGQNGILIKGFDPTSPHRGSTVVATFYWLGSSNIIDSVTDHLNDPTFTPVGNRYTLVEYVTAGGISMATYVATNIQGFADPSPPGGPVLAVRANLSQPVTDGGVKISAWTGVEPDFSLALGAHRSASGSGSTLTTAAPGAIAVGGGALAYAVTMSNGMVGVTPPGGFTSLGGTSSDDFIVEDGRYRVTTSAETVDPRWTWHFDSPSTWLATVLALNPGDPPPTGSLTVNTSTEGSSPDPDGYTVTVSGMSRSVPPSGSVTLTVPAGEQSVALTGVAGNCTVSGANPRTVTVPDGGTTSTSFSVSCTAGGAGATRIGGVGTIGPGTATAGSNRQEFDFDVASDVTGRLFYRDWSIVRAEGGVVTITVAATDASTRITAFRDGSTACADPTRGAEFDGTGRLDNGALMGFTVRACDNGAAGSGADFFEMFVPSASYLRGGLLSGGDVAKSTTAPPPNQPPTANFTFSCSGLTCSFTSTSSDPDGTIASYSWTFGDGTSSTAQNPSKTYAAGGSYTVTLTVTDNQGATSAPVSKTVTVTVPNQSPTASFTFSCSGLTCSFTSTSSDPDGTIAGYNWTFGDGTSSTLQNPSHTYAAGGSYTVTLSVTDNQGATSAPFSRTVTVTAPNQPPTANFTFSCSGLTCSFTSTSSDPDGTIASYDWTFGDGTSSTLQNPSHTYAAWGSYTVTLTVTDNQGAMSAPTSKTVGVTPPNQPPVANFTFSCSGLSCSFTSTSSDPDGTIAAYNWTFGDGTSSTLQNPSKTYAAGGSYSVTLTVTDNQGATSAPFSRTVTVTAPNQSPTANFTFSCSGLTCSFTSTSSDPDGTIASYNWTFGDGTSSTAQNPSKTYATGGSYTVTLRVTDNQGAASAPTSKTVTVNQPPTANFTFSCSGLTCSFTSTSSDPDGTIASYSWTFGDGTSSTVQNPSHTYAAGGSYTVTLTVTDNQGATSAPTSKTVTVTAPNQAPTANFTFSCSGLTCTFTSTSSDPDGSITAYNWTFGDGTSSTLQNPSKTYAAGGSYTVTLRVTDNQGATSAPTSKTVTVTAPNQPPVVDAGPDETALTGLLYTLRWSFSDANGNGPWSYRIEWGDGSTSTGTVSSQGTFSTGHTYVTLLPRDFTIRVTVTDGAGASGSDTKVVTVLLF